MFRLSTRGQYSLKAMLDLSLAVGTQPTSGRMIAERQGIPAPFLEKLLLDLRRAGLVVSQRGAQGGYRLSRPPEEIRVYQILLAVGESLTWPEPQPQQATDWVTASLWRRLSNVCQQALQNLTLADLYYDVRSRMATDAEPFYFIV
ncbi:rrf2 family protein (putative transcriptional regulator) [Gloeomargarita lithophora Alchichica-D10]|uniref:Rrf2 family protein (Putative transcriptional regulator) n=1 Tax=Gloeomargarita lithophora Alchichica-D10 TaxID=1188229 RepID=A0A1J0AB79_9CYAN|nr:Rrf2 family transcriptional regulator [Gloeomargarita lithophora]APB33187.1 rrf2 family protein (putative transcriptional regulator) [Gloeomargarita lithophora Alchichica-D10]